MIKKKLTVPAVLPDGKVYGGITMREYYAIMVIQGLIASGSDIATTKSAHAHRNEKLARRAVEVADALLNELERTS